MRAPSTVWVMCYIGVSMDPMVFFVAGCTRWMNPPNHAMTHTALFILLMQKTTGQETKTLNIF